MYKVPSKVKKSISQELKRFLPLIKNLQARGKQSSEDDARILLNDILSDVLGYDKYNELRTEMREKNSRFDYVVKITDGPTKKKPKQFDFVIEAKAAHVALREDHVNQTLTYCLQKGMDYFFLTNAVKWQLYVVKHSKKSPSARLIHEVDFSTSNSVDSLAEEFYLFTKHSYLNGDWKSVVKHVKATKVEDVVAIILSDKIVKSITREIAAVSGVKVSIDAVKDIIENQIVKSEVSEVNKKLLKSLNAPAPKKTKKPKKEAVAVTVNIEAESSVEVDVELNEDHDIEREVA